MHDSCNMDADHVILAQTGHAKLGHSTDDTLGHVENGRSGFDGVEKPPYDPTFYDDDGKPRRKGNLTFSPIPTIFVKVRRT